MKKCLCFFGLVILTVLSACPSVEKQACYATDECDDGVYCNGVEDCLDGNCVDGRAIECDDEIECTLDSCQEAQQTCQHLPEHSRCGSQEICLSDRGCQLAPCEYDPDCNDGLFCNGIESCDQGRCTGVGVDCNDHVDCTDDECAEGDGQALCQNMTNDNRCSPPKICDSLLGCIDPPCQQDLDCDDGNFCTQDRCQADGLCQQNSVEIPDAEGPAGSPNCTGAVDEDCDGLTDQDDPDCVVCEQATDCDDHNACTTDDCQANVCLNQAVTDDSECDDGNLCTEHDACIDGACLGSAAIECAALGECYQAGQCDPLTGLCSNPKLPDASSCSSDGLSCTDDVCQDGICRHLLPADACLIETACFFAEEDNPQQFCQWCDPAQAQDQWSNKEQGTECDDEDDCTLDTCDINGSCVGLLSPRPDMEGPAGHDSCSSELDEDCDGLTDFDDPDCISCNISEECDDTEPCTMDDCIDHVCVNEPVDGEDLCDDLNLCTQTDSCQEGICLGSDQIECLALDACHLPGSCNPQTGLCSHPEKQDGLDCPTDSLSCTNDVCRVGICQHELQSGWCIIDGACYLANENNPQQFCQHCDPAKATDLWSNKDLDTTCDDGDSCTRDTCNELGQCQGVLVPIPGLEGPPGHASCASDQDEDCDGLTDLDDPDCIGCNNPSECDDYNDCTIDDCVNNLCQNTPLDDDSSCDDLNACTQLDQCRSGICVGFDQIQCSAQDECHLPGTCAPQTGLCSQPEKDDNTACSSDGNQCTNDICLAGVCQNQALDQVACNDNDLCTQTDTCVSGSCVGSNPVHCSAQDECHWAGTCNTETGLCSNPEKDDHTTCSSDGNQCTNDICLAGVCQNQALDQVACNDDDLCTQTDTCVSGSCVGSNPVQCSAQDECHLAGTCNTETGQCSNPEKDDNTACTPDSNDCTNDVCLSGICQNLALTDTACTDNNLCTQTDTCVSGSCVGGNPITCPEPEDCRLPGSCDSQTGQCSNPKEDDYTACEPDNLDCTDDVCRAGFCEHPMKASKSICLIDGVCYNSNDDNPDQICQYCLPSSAPYQWTNKDTGTVCGHVAEDEFCVKSRTCDSELGTCMTNHRDSAWVCDTEEVFSCENGTDCGSNVYRSIQERYCSGSSAACDGSVSNWTTPAVHLSCDSRHACNASTAQCENRVIDDRWSKCVPGIIIDLTNNLAWKEESAKDLSWTEARDYCADQGGSWRLPNINELRTLFTNCSNLEACPVADPGCLDEDCFVLSACYVGCEDTGSYPCAAGVWPDTCPNLWSSSLVTNANKASHWTADFYYGRSAILSLADSLSHDVRCVFPIYH